MNETTIKETLEPFLQDVGEITKRHNQMTREKGEDFSLFSIMRMETNETYTHSAIIATLLDPEQNHYEKAFFLEKFLKKVGYELDGENLEKTKVTREFHIGKIDQAYEKGGFIDILIRFNTGRTIAIENKIDAHDQKHQLYRYSKYNQSNTTLFYLNRYGSFPPKHSYYKLKLETIKIISYKESIIEWLTECQEFLKPDSILSISIKKYILLLKKLTNTMDKPLEKELTSFILNNFEAAKYVHGNFDKLINTVREDFRQAVISELESKLDKNVYKIKPGNTSANLHSQIWIELKNTKNSTLCFGVESFSGRGNKGGIMLVGVFDKLTQGIKVDFVEDSTDTSFSNWWPVFRPLKTTENNILHLNSGALLNKLADNESQSFKDLLDNTITQVVKFIDEYKIEVEEIERKRANDIENYSFDEANQI